MLTPAMQSNRNFRVECTVYVHKKGTVPRQVWYAYIAMDIGRVAVLFGKSKQFPKEPISVERVDRE